RPPRSTPRYAARRGAARPSTRRWNEGPRQEMAYGHDHHRPSAFAPRELRAARPAQLLDARARALVAYLSPGRARRAQPVRSRERRLLYPQRSAWALEDRAPRSRAWLRPRGNLPAQRRVAAEARFPPV